MSPSIDDFFSQRQIKDFEKWKKVLEKQSVKQHVIRADKAQEEISKILQLRGFERGGLLVKYDFDLIFRLMKRIASNMRLNRRLYVRNGLEELNKKLRSLYYGEAPFLERVNDFSKLLGVGLQTLSQFLLVLDPKKYPLITSPTVESLRLTPQQEEKAMKIAIKRFQIEDPKECSKDTLDYLKYFIIFEKIKTLLNLENYIVVNSLIWFANAMPIELIGMREERPREPMKISIKNFGPITKADVTLKPLTIIIGRNNIGKSMLAQLVYTLLEFKNTILEGRRIRYYFERPDLFWIRERPYPYEKEIPQPIQGLARHIRKERPKSKEIFDALLEFTINAHVLAFQPQLNSLLEQYFGVSAESLVNVKSSKAFIRCKITQHLLLQITIPKRGKLKVAIIPKKSYIAELERQYKPIIDRIRRSRKRTEYLILELCGRISTRLFQTEKIPYYTRRLERRAFYVPAGRAGLIESYETVVSALIGLSPVAPIRGITMPPMPGMASQFYNMLIRLRGRKSPLGKLISDPFRELFGGDILVQQITQQKLRPRFLYKFEMGKKTMRIELLHAASMVKELAPIYLIVQELIVPGNWLLIEEPESHLHPGAQFKLLDIMRRLVNNNVNILITTHSDIILRRTAHLVGMSQLDYKEERFNRNNTAIYLLKETEEGSKSKELVISKYGALDEIPTFDEVIKELYDEEVSLQSRIAKEE